ncbi:MAG TPA: membrane protein insertase YidC [Verrucomicrobiae bacterium]|nr:membrane protein insertase YidC [Verrucomicrobiae bacterium]
MDRTGIIVVTICALLLGVWFIQEQKYQAHRPPAQPLATNAAATGQTPAGSPSTTTATSVATPWFDAGSNAPESLITLTNVDARYTFTSRGGGLKTVELSKYPDSVSLLWKKQMTTNDFATLNAGAPVPVLAILGDPSLVGDGNFTLTKTANGVRAEKVFADGLQLVKEFHISSNYLVNASVSLRNGSDRPLAVPAQQWIVGTATPMGLDDSGFAAYGGAMWCNGTNSPGDCTVSYFSPSTTTFFVFPRTPKTVYQEGAGNVAWAAVHNQFFTLMAMPKQPAQHMVAVPVKLPLLATNQSTPPEGVQAALVYPAQILAANASVEREVTLYAGPKEYRTLALIGDQFNNHADYVMQFGFFGFFAKGLLLAMNWLHDTTTLGYGWVIVLITVIIKIVFWPLTAASTRSMKRMQALAPELAALKEKYKDDLQKFTQKQWDVYKRNKVSPMSGCLPMLIQTPIFIGFFTMIRSAIELRGAHFLWVADLSKPDTLFIIPGIDFPFNLLPLLMGASMLWQSHLTPPAPGMDPAQAKMMRYLPLIFLVFLYNYSAGLALYWTVNNLLTIVQTKLTKNIKVTLPATVTVSPLTPVSKKKK